MFLETMAPLYKLRSMAYVDASGKNSFCNSIHYTFIEISTNKLDKIPMLCKRNNRFNLENAAFSRQKTGTLFYMHFAQTSYLIFC